MGISVEPPGPDIGATSSPTLGAYGKVTAPGAGGTIAALGALAAGSWLISGNIYVDGTATAADDDNMELIAVGTFVLICPAETTANGQVIAPIGPYLVESNGALAPTIKAVAGGGAAAIYHALLRADAA
jgi:hypothetical protein